jgi:hypothetical protein
VSIGTFFTQDLLLALVVILGVVVVVLVDNECVVLYRVILLDFFKNNPFLGANVAAAEAIPRVFLEASKRE